MDATENDLPPDVGFTVEGFPTLKLFKANSNEVVDYGGDRSFADLQKFLKENAVHADSFEVTELGAKEPEAEAEEDEEENDEL